jgi:hypothetical protein
MEIDSVSETLCFLVFFQNSGQWTKSIIPVILTLDHVWSDTVEMEPETAGDLARGTTTVPAKQLLYHVCSADGGYKKSIYEVPEM